MERKQGVLTDIIFHNEENGYTVAEMETEEELLTIVGVLPSAAAGTFFELKGEMKVHPRFGEQFAFTEAMEIMPSSERGILSFLSSGVVSGIGPKMAAAVVGHFGKDTLNIMESEPERLQEVPGIGKKKAKAISESFNAHRDFARVAMALEEFGISSSQSVKLYQAYGSAAPAVIMENPYRLVEEVRGIGFRRADEIARKIGIPADSPYRISSGILYLLQYISSDGSTYIPREDMCERVAMLLDLTREQINGELVQMAFEGDVQIDRINGQDVVYLFVYYQAEQKVCRCLRALREAEIRPLAADMASCILMTEDATDIHLSPGQKEAVCRSADSGVSVITGGPGTGKTTIINTLISIFEESDFRVSIAAPTGRAAKRITETSGHYASTIHRLLEYYFDEETSEMRFGKTAEEPLDTDVVIVDEASMIDLLLMEGLVSAMRPGTRLILVGDSDQLPSVGAGNVLMDLIESGFVTTSRLTEIYRQAQESMIVVNAHRINHGEFPTLNGKDTDFFFMERRSEQKMQELIVDLVTRRLPAYYSDLDPLSDIQVLSPTRKGPVGTAELNRKLQDAFNPPRGAGALQRLTGEEEELLSEDEVKPEKSFGDKVFRAGDKVMQIRNNYEMEWKAPGRSETGSGVFNGDMGFIVGIDTENAKLTVRYDDRYCQYEFSQLDELELAYAVTVHKSQGSEFPVVVMPVSWFPPMLATRNLLYTAVTRGKQAVVLVGVPERLAAMIQNDRTSLRFSGLKYRLSDMMAFDNPGNEDKSE